MSPWLHYKDTQHCLGYYIEITVTVDYLRNISVTCREVNGKLPNKTYERKLDPFQSWYKEEIEEYILSAFKDQVFLYDYLNDTIPKPLITKPVDRKRISRDKKDRVFRLLKEIKNV